MWKVDVDLYFENSLIFRNVMSPSKDFNMAVLLALDEFMKNEFNDYDDFSFTTKLNETFIPGYPSLNINPHESFVFMTFTPGYPYNRLNNFNFPRLQKLISKACMDSLGMRVISVWAGDTKPYYIK